MSIKTIIVYVDDTERAGVRIALAAQLALEYDAHLIGLAATGWAPLLGGAGAGDPIFPVPPVDTEPARLRCRHALAAFEAQARGLDVVSIESRLVEEEAGLALALHGRYSDLVVVGQTRGVENGPMVRPDFPEFVMLGSTVPVLVVPAYGEFKTLGRKVAVAWNGGGEARRAIGTALPVLCRADKVHVLMINPTAGVEASGREPGTDIGLYLARHGVHVEVDVDGTDQDAGDALIEASSRCGADLVVMGAYGRSRLREFLMGGATRTMLDAMRVPVWMAH